MPIDTWTLNWSDDGLPEGMPKTVANPLEGEPVEVVEPPEPITIGQLWPRGVL